MKAVVSNQWTGAGAADVFHTQAWFRHLQAHGLAVTPHVRLLQQDTTAGPVSFHLLASPETGGLFGLANYYSGLFGPVASAEALAAWDAAGAAMTLRQGAGSAVLDMHPLDAQAPWLAAWEEGLRRSGYWTDRYFCFGNWYQPVELGRFDDYWAARPSALRNTVARARKRLDRQGDWRLDIVTGEQPELEAAIGAYVSVYNRSWKTPEPNPAFIPGLIRLAAQQGWLRLGLVYVAGEPVAAQLWLVAGGKANIFKLAYVQGFEKLSAGSVLSAELMRHVIDVDGVKEVDFLSGDDPYKADWMSHRRERIGLVAFDQRHWRGWMAAGLHLLHLYRQRMKQIVSFVGRRR